MASLSSLPSELLAHIASSADALTALRLSATSRKLWRSSYDILVFRAILEDSLHAFWERTLWYRPTPYLEAISVAAGRDVQTWARYALADQRARELPIKQHSWLSLQETSRSWLPELFTIKHPVLFRQFGTGTASESPTRSMQLEFCRALSTLAGEQEVNDAQFAVYRTSNLELRTDESTHLSLLATIATILRAAVRTRLAAWPYNASSQSPYIQPPLSSQIPISLAVPLPIPFMGCRQWKTWYERYNDSLLSSSEYFTDGAWVGYYTPLSSIQPHYPDPPMTVHFSVVPTPEDSTHELTLQADDCRDGVGSFTIRGGLSHTRDDGTGEVRFKGVKQYTNTPTAWSWDLRLTPFGLTGFWGSDVLFQGRDLGRGMSRMGYVWLWKRGWTEESCS